MKRIYSEDGTQSMPAVVMKLLLLIALPFVLAHALACGIGHGVREGVLDCRGELASLKRLWGSAR